MKVLLVNGSPHEHGCTDRALSIIADSLRENGVESEFFWVGVRPVSGCLACGLCRKTGRCAINDRVNDFLDLAEKADGFVFGSPVHYASASGAMVSFMDRAFCAGGRLLRMKPAACIASARRAGTTAALDQLNKYLLINEMPVVSSCYWPMVHGSKPEEVMKDEEGVAIMQTLGRNMAWLLRAIEAAKAAGINPPAPQSRPITNFIR